MAENRLHQQLQFILEIDRLKQIIRQSYLLSGERLENSAEHSWHIAMMAILLTEYIRENANLLKVLLLKLMPVIHMPMMKPPFKTNPSGKIGLQIESSKYCLKIRPGKCINYGKSLNRIRR